MQACFERDRRGVLSAAATIPTKEKPHGRHKIDSGREETAELSITIKGARSREAALSTILDMLKPEWATVAKVAESSNGFKQDGDSYTLFARVCCWEDQR